MSTQNITAETKSEKTETADESKNNKNSTQKTDNIDDIDSSFTMPLPHYRIFDEEYSTLDESYTQLGFVGEGAYGVVIKAQVKNKTMNNNNNTSSASTSTTTTTTTTPSIPEYVAIKQMMNPREGQGITQDAYREIKILKELQHENIVKLEHVYMRPVEREVDLVYDYAEHDLSDIIRFHRTKQIPCDARYRNIAAQ